MVCLYCKSTQQILIKIFKKKNDFAIDFKFFFRYFEITILFQIKNNLLLIYNYHPNGIHYKTNSC